ncbi:MAG: hypothetical protein IKM20_07435 [Erysipelotrichales bacterium]|nr:hypothetical protein [Erysipelotrichales bacterium]
MKSKSNGFVMLDSLMSFLIILVSIELISAYNYLKSKNYQTEYADFSHYYSLNNIFYNEGADYRYDEMYERVQSY